MRKAFDKLLSDYIDAEVAAKNGSSEAYRYVCACCWEEVRLCAADSENQATHFRHYNGNNNIECENYLGNSIDVIRTALSRINGRDKIEFYFASDTKTFNIGVKFGADEIAIGERDNIFFQVSGDNSANPIISVPINTKRFYPDSQELIQIHEHAWSYYISTTNDSKQHKYDLFRKVKGDVYPSFFKKSINEEHENFRAKLVRSETLYTNTSYLVVFASAHQHAVFDFQKDAEVGKVFNFKTMEKNFTAADITFTNKSKEIEQLLEKWGFKLETSENLSLLWPPSFQADGTANIKTKHAYIFSTFLLQAHSNINVNLEDVVSISKGLSRVSVSKQTKVYKKNAELLLSQVDIAKDEYVAIPIEHDVAELYESPDDESYMFNHSGVSQIGVGTREQLTRGCEVRHYTHGYLDRIVKSAYVPNMKSSEQILCDILMYYRREEPLVLDDFASLNLSQIATSYIESCSETRKINTAAKRFIEEGRI
jgi:hypothetical protein